MNRIDYADEIRLTLKAMEEWSGTAARRFYVASFSEQRDLLSQWRAYCPLGGGYSIGIPSTQLASMAAEQVFTLVPCVYEHKVKYKIATEWVDHFVARFSQRALNGAPIDETRKAVAWEFWQHIAHYGTALKHHSFTEEAEWRVISGPTAEDHVQVDFRPTDTAVVPYFRFKLASDTNPNLAKNGEHTLTLIAGPNSDTLASGLTSQFILTKFLSGAAHGSSEIPYRKR